MLVDACGMADGSQCNKRLVCPKHGGHVDEMVFELIVAFLQPLGYFITILHHTFHMEAEGLRYLTQ